MHDTQLGSSWPVATQLSEQLSQHVPQTQLMIALNSGSELPHTVCFGGQLVARQPAMNSEQVRQGPSPPVPELLALDDEPPVPLEAPPVPLVEPPDPLDAPPVPPVEPPCPLEVEVVLKGAPDSSSQAAAATRATEQTARMAVRVIVASNSKQVHL